MFALLLLVCYCLVGLTYAETSRNIVIYDGDCNLCSKFVDILLNVDVTKRFTYCALQSKSGRKIMEDIGKTRDDLSSVIFIRSTSDNVNKKDKVGDIKEVYVKSDAILEIAKELGFPLPFLSLLCDKLPKSFRDGLYDLIATNRYSLFGKREGCRCSDKSHPERFL